MEDAQVLAIVAVVLATDPVPVIVIPLAILHAILPVQEHVIQLLVVLHVCRSQETPFVQQTCTPSMGYARADVLPSALEPVPRVVFQSVQGPAMLMVS